jgi:hypothetical protein
MPPKGSDAAAAQHEAIRQAQLAAEQPNDEVYLLIKTSPYDDAWTLAERNAFEGEDEDRLRRVRLANYPRSKRPLQVRIGALTIEVPVHYGLAGTGYVRKEDLEPYLEAIAAEEQRLAAQAGEE